MEKMYSEPTTNASFHIPHTEIHDELSYLYRTINELKNEITEIKRRLNIGGYPMGPPLTPIGGHCQTSIGHNPADPQIPIGQNYINRLTPDDRVIYLHDKSNHGLPH